jgi:chromosome segregation ATPase
MAASNRPSDIRRAIDKLIDIHADISKMLALHDQRLGQHEKTHEVLTNEVEKRRMEIHNVTGDLYKEIDQKTTSIMDEIKKLSEKTFEQHNKINEKITSLSRFIWIGVGLSIGLSALISIVTITVNILHLIK